MAGSESAIGLIRKGVDVETFIGYGGWSPKLNVALSYELAYSRNSPVSQNKGPSGRQRRRTIS